VIFAASRYEKCRQEERKKAPAKFAGAFGATMLTKFEAWADRRQAPPRPVLTELKVVLRLPPTVVTAVMITTEMRAAISPYSIAVAPDSSRRNFFKICIDYP
jgi:hypothetical protein